jgi:hypothetical protein
LIFFPLALVGGTIPAVGAWLLGITLTQILRIALRRYSPDWLTVALPPEKAVRLHSTALQLLVGATIGAVSGYLMYLATHNLTMYKPTLTGQGIDFQYVDTMASLTCGLLSAAIALRRPKESSPEAT